MYTDACVRACVRACVWVWTQLITRKSVIVSESVPIVDTVTEINVVTRPEIVSEFKTVRSECPQYPEYALHKPSLTIFLSGCSRAFLLFALWLSRSTESARQE